MAIESVDGDDTGYKFMFIHFLNETRGRTRLQDYVDQRGLVDHNRPGGQSSTRSAIL
jgi:hypothetical protein